MSYETSAFQDEIDKLDDRITSLKQKGAKLRKFILSTKFLEEFDPTPMKGVVLIVPTIDVTRISRGYLVEFIKLQRKF